MNIHLLKKNKFRKKKITCDQNGSSWNELGDPSEGHSNIDCTFHDIT